MEEIRQKDEADCRQREEEWRQRDKELRVQMELLAKIAEVKKAESTETMWVNERKPKIALEVGQLVNDYLEARKQTAKDDQTGKPCLPAPGTKPDRSQHDKEEGETSHHERSNPSVETPCQQSPATTVEAALKRPCTVLVAVGQSLLFRGLAWWKCNVPGARHIWSQAVYCTRHL
ncbi:hypothetical protein EMCRGX_G001125 [Ephydatia muelleri]